MKNNIAHLGVGTPNRILKLIEEGMNTFLGLLQIHSFILQFFTNQFSLIDGVWKSRGGSKILQARGFEIKMSWMEKL